MIYIWDKYEKKCFIYIIISILCIYIKIIRLVLLYYIILSNMNKVMVIFNNLFMVF